MREKSVVSGKVLLVVFSFLVVLNIQFLQQKANRATTTAFKKPVVRTRNLTEPPVVYTRPPTSGGRNFTILIWTPFWSSYTTWERVFKRHLSNSCPETRCHLSYDRKNAKSADAILFNGNNLDKKVKSLFEYFLPGARPKRWSEEQIFVFFSLEPPPLLEDHKLESYDNFFNWTMTYRHDSDVVMPYGKVLRRRNPAHVWYVTENELKSKKMAVWMSSHCTTQSKRVLFVNELQKYIPVDTYGLCGTLKCGEKTTVPKVEGLGQDPCEDLMKTYTFYLALENSLCTDYVTEKLYRTLFLGIIPVVYGKANYTAIAPPNSVINADDFETIEELAAYLKKVATNHTLYNKYLKWREDFEIEIGSPYSPMVCGLCEKLHDTTATRIPQWYPSIKSWYVDNMCSSPKRRKTETSHIPTYQ